MKPDRWLAHKANRWLALLGIALCPARLIVSPARWAGDIRHRKLNLCKSLRGAVRACEEFGHVMSVGRSARPPPVAEFLPRTQSAIGRPPRRAASSSSGERRYANRVSGAYPTETSAPPAPERAHAGVRAHFVRIGAIDRPARRDREGWARSPNRSSCRVMGGGSSSSRGKSVRQFARRTALLRGLLIRCPQLLGPGGAERTGNDPVEHIGLLGFERDQPAEHVEESANPRYIRQASRQVGSFPAATAAAGRQYAAWYDRGCGS